MQETSNSEVLNALLTNALEGLSRTDDIVMRTAYQLGYLKGFVLNLMQDVPGVRTEMQQRIEAQNKLKEEDHV